MAIVVVGESGNMGPQGTNGEGNDIASLDLTGMQEDLSKSCSQYRYTDYSRTDQRKSIIYTLGC